MIFKNYCILWSRSDHRSIWGNCSMMPL